MTPAKSLMRLSNYARETPSLPISSATLPVMCAKAHLPAFSDFAGISLAPSQAPSPNVGPLRVPGLQSRCRRNLPWEPAVARPNGSRAGLRASRISGPNGRHRAGDAGTLDRTVGATRSGKGRLGKFSKGRGRTWRSAEKPSDIRRKVGRISVGVYAGISEDAFWRTQRR